MTCVLELNAREYLLALAQQFIEEHKNLVYVGEGDICEEIVVSAFISSCPLHTKFKCIDFSSRVSPRGGCTVCEHHISERGRSQCAIDGYRFKRWRVFREEVLRVFGVNTRDQDRN